MTDTILGLTCISEELKQKDKAKYSFKTMTRKRFKTLCNQFDRNEALNQLSERILHNIIVTQYIINHCARTNIKHYRLSSALFPLITDQSLEISLEELPHFATINQELRLAGLMAFSLRVSISIHPDQFNVLASPNANAVERTIRELNFQSSILDKLGLPQDHTCPINIHLNCAITFPKKVEIDPESLNNYVISEIADRFYKNLMRCDQGVIKRLTLENEDRGHWNVDNIIIFSEYLFNKYDLNIPICYDNLHDKCNPSEILDVKWQAERCAYTWVKQGDVTDGSHFLSPVFHWSEGKNDGSNNPRAHGDYFSFKNHPPIIAIDPDSEAKWECEVKAKDLAIRKLVND
tara:strand:- start:2538 stop:3581 length:1044 start_codon:yes stop_codon:yes gene_type:complete